MTKTLTKIRCTSEARLVLGVPLEDIFPGGDVHPTLKNLFVDIFESLSAANAPLKYFLSYETPKDDNFRVEATLALYDPVDLMPTSTLLWMLRHFIGSLPLPLLPRYTDGQSFTWLKLSDRCKSAFESYVRDRNANQFLVDRLSDELLRLPPVNLLLIGYLVNFLRSLVVHPGRKDRFSRSSTVALVKYFGSSVFIRPYHRKRESKCEQHYRPLMLYLLISWPQIQASCMKKHPQCFVPVAKRANFYNNPAVLAYKENIGTQTVELLPTIEEASIESFEESKFTSEEVLCDTERILSEISESSDSYITLPDHVSSKETGCQTEDKFFKPRMKNSSTQTTILRDELDGELADRNEVWQTKKENGRIASIQTFIGSCGEELAGSMSNEEQKMSLSSKCSIQTSVMSYGKELDGELTSKVGSSVKQKQKSTPTKRKQKSAPVVSCSHNFESEFLGSEERVKKSLSSNCSTQTSVGSSQGGELSSNLRNREKSKKHPKVLHLSSKIFKKSVPTYSKQHPLIEDHSGDEHFYDCQGEDFNENCKFGVGHFNRSQRHTKNVEQITENQRQNEFFKDPKNVIQAKPSLYPKISVENNNEENLGRSNTKLKFIFEDSSRENSKLLHSLSHDKCPEDPKIWERCAKFGWSYISSKNKTQSEIDDKLMGDVNPALIGWRVGKENFGDKKAKSEEHLIGCKIGKEIAIKEDSDKDLIGAEISIEDGANNGEDCKKPNVLSSWNNGKLREKGGIKSNLVEEDIEDAKDTKLGEKKKFIEELPNELKLMHELKNQEDSRGNKLKNDKKNSKGDEKQWKNDKSFTNVSEVSKPLKKKFEDVEILKNKTGCFNNVSEVPKPLKKKFEDVEILKIKTGSFKCNSEQGSGSYESDDLECKSFQRHNVKCGIPKVNLENTFKRKETLEKSYEGKSPTDTLEKSCKWTTPKETLEQSYEWKTPKETLEKSCEWTTPKETLEKSYEWKTPKENLEKSNEWKTPECTLQKSHEWKAYKETLQKSQEWKTPKHTLEKTSEWKTPEETFGKPSNMIKHHDRTCEENKIYDFLHSNSVGSNQNLCEDNLLELNLQNDDSTNESTGFHGDYCGSEDNTLKINNRIKDNIHRIKGAFLHSKKEDETKILTDEETRKAPSNTNTNFNNASTNVETSLHVTQSGRRVFNFSKLKKKIDVLKLFKPRKLDASMSADRIHSDVRYRKMNAGRSTTF